MSSFKESFSSFFLKVKPFAKKTFHFLTKMPVVVTLVILIPVLIFTGRYIFKGDVTYFYEDFYFSGEKIHSDHETFKLEKITKLFSAPDFTSTHNYQGGTCFEDYYVVCSNNFESIVIYDMTKKKVDGVVYTEQYNTDYHCNTCFFGEEYYVRGDKFPILYISMENAPVHSTIGFRIYQLGGSYHIKEVQRLVYTMDVENLYFTNSYYDYSDGQLYYGGYTKNSYRKSPDNLLKFYVFDLPYYKFQLTHLKQSEASESFELPSETATQGGFISEGYLYQTFCFHKNDDIDNAPKMRVVDLEKKQIIHDFQDLGIYGVYDEFENIAISRSGHLYAHGNYHFNIYEFEYTDAHGYKPNTVVVDTSIEEESESELY